MITDSRGQAAVVETGRLIPPRWPQLSLHDTPTTPGPQGRCAGDEGLALGAEPSHSKCSLAGVVPGRANATGSKIDKNSRSLKPSFKGKDTDKPQQEH